MTTTTYALELMERGRLYHEAMTIQLSDAVTGLPIAEVSFEFHDNSMLCSVIDMDDTLSHFPTIMHAPGFVMNILDQYYNDDCDLYADIFFHDDEDGDIVKHRITHTVEGEVAKKVAA